jgi:116 kDa U5 small nuclear ribonucleoprotein component
LEDSREKNYCFNFIDAPGHPNFSDEVSASLRLADSVLMVVDVVEGMTSYLEKQI